MAAVILWFRNDLRLSDHAALAAAVETGPVVPVFVLDDAAADAWKLGGAARWWLHHSLAALGASLERRGAGLVLRRGRAETVLPALARETGAEAVFAGAAAEPWAREQERRVGESLPLHLTRTVSLFAPETIRTKAGKPYGVYTPFARACLAAGAPHPVGAPRRIPSPAARARSERLEDWHLLPRHPDWAGGLRETWAPGEAGARRRLAAFRRAALADYDSGRNRTGEDGTSMLSPHLHFGEISAAAVWQAASAADRGRSTRSFLGELLWREFAQHLLWHHSGLPDRPLRPAFARMPWRHDAASRRAWERGRTGVPMVDAAMRQLWHTGWMHNRARMIVASFLVKHLLLPWQDGERWFWDTLVDADLANNSVNWQWVAGSGADAAPYFRVFNPVLQGAKFDADGAYVRRWVPELARLPDGHLHAPWDAPDDVLRQAGVRLGETYPRPIVDLAAGRERALAAYRGLAQAAE